MGTTLRENAVIYILQIHSESRIHLSRLRYPCHLFLKRPRLTVTLPVTHTA